MPSLPVSRRRFLTALPALPLALRASDDAAKLPSATAITGDLAVDPGTEPLRIALIADCQYADVEPAKPVVGRQYLRSPRKLADAVAALSKLKPHAAVHLGDLIDRDFQNFGVVKPVFDAFACPRFHVAGNHDYGVADADKPRVRAALDIPEPGYREVTAAGWTLIFLESNETGLMRHAAGSPEYAEAEKERRRRLAMPTHARFAQSYNGGLGERQRAWLDGRLSIASGRGQKVVIFTHQPAVPDDMHSLWDTPETLELLAKHPHVVAWINGHNHAGGYRRIGATHHLNLKGMIETLENTYALATFHPDRIEIAGFGREPSRTLMF